MAKSKMLNNQYDFIGLSIDDLIAKPLIAIAKAQDSMAKQQVASLLKDCFYHDGHYYQPKMLKMTLERSVIEPGKKINEPPEIKQIITHFNLPLITIFPISSLGIESVNIDFEMEVTSQYSLDIDEDEDEDEVKENDIISGLKPLVKRDSNIEILAKIAPRSQAITHDNLNVNASESTSTNTMYSIDVVAGPLPLTKGLLSILDLYTNAIEPVKMPEEKNANL